MKRNCFLFVMIVTFFSWLAGADLVWASEAPVAPTDRMDYGTGVGKKLGRGLSNVAFGWLEFPQGIQDIGEKNNFIAAVTWGPIYGLGKTVLRTAAGVYEVGTFPLPVPEGFRPLLEPEFMLGDQP
ncbi:MAG: hypothetical protein COT00_05000 [Candidatus Omnitrophica bacterium CG07_land_8_20_14_0_80_50_8]|nr:MAG: hypothetical protein AUJ71_04370 [Candidatus Omnitrophica bacterium CG1_02_49_16]PIU39808.1 MAG: hypothetical protein COT00_05000 [Candidatus Omnitrophica bacterium CG07_land_8_20_14_0_80_50_8]